MSMPRSILSLVALLATLPAAGCGGAECSPDENRCEGSVAWACEGEGDGRHWETRTCGDGTRCGNGYCFEDPLVPCHETVAPGDRGCSPDGTRPGTCSEAGYWAWDEGVSCQKADEEVCKMYRSTSDPGLTWARCVLDPPSGCTFGTSPAVCHNDIVVTCSEVFYYAKDRDCAAEGKACRSGACTD